MMQRIILHFDLDAFFCAVEEKSNPDLISKAFAVGGEANQRGVVASCSYPARMVGVHSAMPMRRAKQLCPDLFVVPQHRQAYSEYSRRVMAMLGNLTPLVEKLSIDEAFLDVTGIKGNGESIARDIQKRVRDELDLPCSIGVASNKLVAKIANNIGKARTKSPEPPCAIEIVPVGSEAAYLAPLPIRELWGVGPKTAASLHELNINTIGDIARQERDLMVYHFGKNGYDMWRHAQGIDNRPVEPEQETKSISREITFTHDNRDEGELKRILRRQAEEVARQLRKSQMNCKTINIKLRWSDFTTLSRQTTLLHPTQDEKLIAKKAIALFDTHWTQGKPVRLIGVGVSNLNDAAVRQLELWETEQTQKSRKLQSTLDDLKERFGDSSVKKGIDIKKRGK
ncbi:MAG: DNA polymerase IV [Anaerolineae bacterium]|nr:DNA polymerase IV [Anaerolineae bacterium]